jgi:hypothetical protein
VGVVYDLEGLLRDGRKACEQQETEREEKVFFHNGR